MIQRTELVRENLIEEKFCNIIDKFNRVKLTNERPLYKLLNKKLKKCFDFTMDDKSKSYIISLCSSPGPVIIYLTYLQYWCFKHKVNHIDFTILLEQIFVDGIFSENDIHKVWIDCKIETTNNEIHNNLLAHENLLDNQHCMGSIRFENKNK